MNGNQRTYSIQNFDFWTYWEAVKFNIFSQWEPLNFVQNLNVQKNWGMPN